jgi:hypothetical protein
MSESTGLTFEANDRLRLKPFSEKLEAYLMVEHDFVEGSLVVSLNAPFGGGKSTFLSMWKSDLDKRRENNDPPPKAIIVNAWESDYCGEPLLSIINGLITAIKEDGSAKKEKEVSRLHEAAKDVGWFFTGIANNLASKWIGIDPAAAGKFAEEKKGERKLNIPDFISLYEERTKALGHLKGTLKDIFGGESPKAFIFIDELDRCRPDYAIHYLETIKHVFDIHGLVFLLAIDYGQLESSAKSLFGENLKFPDYFRKFSHRTLALPEPTESGLQDLSFAYVGRYVQRENKRTSLLNPNYDSVKIIVDLVTALKMPPRQIQEMFRIVGHLLATIDQRYRGQIHVYVGIGAIFMSALKVANPEMYRLIGREEISHADVGKFLIALFGKQKAEHWFYVYVAAANRKGCAEKADLERLFKGLGFIDPDAVYTDERLSRIASGWGDHWAKQWWKTFYEKVEAAETL